MISKASHSCTQTRRTKTRHKSVYRQGTRWDDGLAPFSGSGSNSPAGPTDAPMPLRESIGGRSTCCQSRYENSAIPRSAIALGSCLPTHASYHCHRTVVPAQSSPPVQSDWTGGKSGTQTIPRRASVDKNRSSYHRPGPPCRPLASTIRHRQIRSGSRSSRRPQRVADRGLDRLPARRLP